ncbi:hypothetical protein JCM6882_008639 [Rhodosporidiobolus microsporus]
MASPVKPDSQGPPCASPLAAHLARFRYNSPTRSPTSSPRSTRRSAPTGAAASSTAPALAPLPPPATPSKPLARKRSTETPPRADGSSRYFKRAAEDDGPSPTAEDEKKTELDEDTPKKKKRKRPARPYADASVYAHLGNDPLSDYMVEDGRLMLCGINPGRLSAEKGLHYANPTNHYWRCLSGSGLTDRLLDPSEGALLSERYGISATNLVPRPTAEMSEISNDEMKACVPSFLRKIIKYRPRVVAFVGMKICEVVLRYLHNLPTPSPADAADGSPSKAKRKRKPAMPKVKIGLQGVTISLPMPGKEGDAEEGEQERRKIYVWCLPSTSARVVEYQLVDKIKIFARLKADLDTLAASSSAAVEGNYGLDLPAGAVDYRAEDLVTPEGEVKEEEEELEGEAGKGEGALGSGWTVTMISAADVASSAPVKEEEM